YILFEERYSTSDMAPKNYFEILEISIGADENQIKKAYRTLAKKWHPDKNSNPGAKEKFQEIAAAYEYLSSKDRREILERDLQRSNTQSQEKQAQPASTFKQTASHPPESSSQSKTKKANAASWSETFTKNYRSQKTKPNAANEKSQTGSGENSNYNFKFTDFKAYRTPSPVSETENLFDDLFGDLRNPRGFSVSGGLTGSSRNTKKKKKPKPRHVAPERGSPTGLDEEYLFTPRHKNQDEYEEKLSCPWCNQAFTRGKLSQHEEKCGKFGLSADEESEDEADADLDYITTISKPIYSWKPVWQQQQDELRDQIRRDKSLYREHLASHDNKNEGLIKCPYCERQFNYTSASKHIPWCKEYVQKYGIPMSRRSSLEKDSQNKRISESELLYEAFGKKKTQDTGAVRERMKEYASNRLKPGLSREHRQEDFFVPGNSMPYMREQPDLFADFTEDEAFISGRDLDPKFSRSSFQHNRTFTAGAHQYGTSTPQYKMHTQGLYGKKL
ncbi:chaperone protein Dnaj, partial [Biomphalaria glabrata]